MKKSTGIRATISLLRKFTVLTEFTCTSFPKKNFTGGTVAEEFSAPSFSKDNAEHTGLLPVNASGSSSLNSRNPLTGTDYSETGMTGMGSGACSPFMTGSAENLTSSKRIIIYSSGNRGISIVLEECPAYAPTGLQLLINSCDQDAVKEWMQTFIGKHRDELPAPPQDGQNGQCELISPVKCPRYYTTEIETLINNGGQEAVKKWMQTFMGEHRDEFPSPPGVA